jgi:hypothetical protein
MNTRDPLRDALASLPREVPPRRDLWPDIAARLGEQDVAGRAAAAAGSLRTTVQPQRPPRRFPTTALIGAGLAAAAMVLLLLPGKDSATLDESRRRLAQVSLVEDYAMVRSDMLAALSVRCDRLPAADCDHLRAGLDDLDRTVQDLKHALDAAPEGSAASHWLTTRLHQTLNQASALSSQTIRLF